MRACILAIAATFAAGCGRTEIVGTPQGTTAGAPGTTAGIGGTGSTVATTGTSAGPSASGTTTGGECATCSTRSPCGVGFICASLAGEKICVKSCQAASDCDDQACLPIAPGEAGCVPRNLCGFGDAATSGPGGDVGTGGIGSVGASGTTGPLSLGITGGTSVGTDATTGGGGECAPCGGGLGCAPDYSCVQFGAAQGICAQDCTSQADCADPTSFCVSDGSEQICVPQSLCGLGGFGSTTGGGFGGGIGGSIGGFGGSSSGFGGTTGGGPCNTDSDCFGRQTCCGGLCSDTHCGLCGETCAAEMCDVTSRCRRDGTCTCVCPDGTQCPDPSAGTKSCATPPPICPAP